MGEEHLPQLGEDRLSPRVPQGEGHVFEGKPHQLGAPRLLRAHRHEGGPRRDDRVAERLCQPPAVPRRAGRGIAAPAGGDEHRVRGKLAAVLQPHAPHASALRQDASHARGCFQPRAGRLRKADERVRHVGRPVGHREHPASPLGLERHAERLEERHRVRRGKGAGRAVEEARIGAHIPQKVLGRAVVGDVAAALAGDQQLAGGARPPLEHRDRRAALRGEARREQPGGSPADHDKVRHRLPPRAFRRPRIRPRSVRDGRRCGRSRRAFSCPPPRSGR